MALTKDKGPWDESAINALYRGYQEVRDGVDYQHYRSILHAARGKSEAVQAEIEMEKRLAVIQEEASRLYSAAKGSHDEASTPSWESVKETRTQYAAPRWREKLMSQITEFIASINPAKLMPVAITVAILAAVTPFVLQNNTKTGSFVTSQLASLEPYSENVANELARLGEFHYGFSASSHTGNVVTPW